MKILVCGNYGAGNLGDEAIAEGMQQVLKEKYLSADIAFLVADRQKFNHFHQGKLKYTIQFPVGLFTIAKRLLTGQIWKTLKSYRECDLFVLGGGGLFHDHEGFFATRLWGIQTAIAHMLKKKVIWYGVSVSPYQVPDWSIWSHKNSQRHRMQSARGFVRKLAGKADEIYLRDIQSKQNLLCILETESEEKIQLCQDAALNIAKNQYATRESNLCIFALNAWYVREKKQQEFWKKKAQEEKRSGNKVVFVEMQTGDLNLDFISEYETVTPGDFSHLTKLYSQASIVYAQRLHGLIVAHTQEVPDIRVYSYNHKVEAVADDLGYDVLTVE